MMERRTNGSWKVIEIIPNGRRNGGGGGGGKEGMEWDGMGREGKGTLKKQSEKRYEKIKQVGG